MIAVETGWSFRLIDELTLPEFNDTFGKLWSEAPPLREVMRMLAIFLGWEPPPTKTDDVGELIAMLEANGNRL